uniref:Uncharacterized protein n=1 Tax=Anguilla anguilla TaxID=7936 RepID=A0A0E9XYP4_ANGAN
MTNMLESVLYSPKKARSWYFIFRLTALQESTWQKYKKKLYKNTLPF